MVHSHSPPHRTKIVGIPTYQRPDIYTVLFQDGSITEYSIEDNLLEAVPTASDVQEISLLPHWIQQDANATLFLESMSYFGFLLHFLQFCNTSQFWQKCAILQNK